MRRIDDNQSRRTDAGIQVFSCVRNEMLRMPFFLRYYRSAGAAGFIFIDNGSTDGTADYLCGQPDTTVYHTHGSFREAQSGIAWIRELINRHAHGRWVVVADADEFLVNPRVGSASLEDLTRWLDGCGHGAMYSLLLDMYSDRSFDETVADPARELWETCPYFEIDHIRLTGYWGPPCAYAPMHVGGVRSRLFGVDCCLDKINLFRARDGVSIQQGMHAIVGASLSPMRSVTLHFKFLSDFRAKASEEAKRGECWNEASEYKRYESRLSRNPSMQAWCERSRRFTGAADLRSIGLITSG